MRRRRRSVLYATSCTMACLKRYRPSRRSPGAASSTRSAAMSSSTESARRAPPASRRTRSPKRWPMTEATWMGSFATAGSRATRAATARWRVAREQVERGRVGEVQVLEDVEERPFASERGDDVVHHDEERPLPLLGVARRLRRSWKVQELRECRRHELGIREAELAKLWRELLRGLLVVRFDPQLDDQRLDETGVAALVDPGERPPQHARGVGRANPFLRRGREADELGEQAGLADPWLPGDEHDLGATDPRGLVGEVETRELHPPADQRRGDVDRRARRGSLAGEGIGEDWPVLYLHLDRSDLAEGELAVREAEGRLGDVDLARRGGLPRTFP